MRIGGELGGGWKEFVRIGGELGGGWKEFGRIGGGLKEVFGRTVED